MQELAKPGQCHIIAMSPIPVCHTPNCSTRTRDTVLFPHNSMADYPRARGGRNCQNKPPCVNNQQKTGRSEICCKQRMSERLSFFNYQIRVFVFFTRGKHVFKLVICWCLKTYLYVNIIVINRFLNNPATGPKTVLPTF